MMKVLSQVLSSAFASRSVSVITGCVRGPVSGVGGSRVDVGAVSVAVLWAVGAVVFVGRGVLAEGTGVEVGGTGVDAGPHPLKRLIIITAKTSDTILLFIILTLPGQSSAHFFLIEPENEYL